MRVLVTGSTGNIGKWVVNRLVEEGFEVTGMDVTGQPPDTRFAYHNGDVRDLATMRSALQGMDAVVHMAAIPFDMPRAEESILDVNIRGTFNMLLASQENGVKRVVNFSSINALGQAEKTHPGLYLPLDDDIPHYNIHNYSLTKHIGEELCASFAARGGLSAVSLRPTMVVEGAKTNFWESMFSQEMKMQGNVNDFFSYVDFRDVAEAVVLALQADTNGHEAFLLTHNESRERIPTAEIIDQHYSHLAWPKISREAYLAQGEYVSLVDCSKARRLLGWVPRYSKFTESAE